MHFTARYGIEDQKKKKRNEKIIIIIWLENCFWLLELQKKQKISFFRRLFFEFFWVPSRFFRLFLAIFFFFHFFACEIKIFVCESNIGRDAPQANFHKKSRWLPRIQKIEKLKYLWIGGFFWTKKSEYFAFFILQTKKHYNVPIGGLWPEIK